MRKEQIITTNNNQMEEKGMKSKIGRATRLNSSHTDSSRMPSSA